MSVSKTILCKSTCSFFLSFITGLGQDFSCEEKSMQLSVEKANAKL